jgi:hypothetical protein
MNINFKKILFFIFFVLSSFLSAQNKTEIDTLRAFELSVPPEIFEYQLENQNYLSDINSSFFKKSFLNDSSSVWLCAKTMIGSFDNQDEIFSDAASKMTAPMFNDYLNSQKLATLKAILGSVQVGAAAYFAYRHIKKYGFLK